MRTIHTWSSALAQLLYYLCVTPQCTNSREIKSLYLTQVCNRVNSPAFDVSVLKFNTVRKKCQHLLGGLPFIGLVRFSPQFLTGLGFYPNLWCLLGLYLSVFLLFLLSCSLASKTERPHSFWLGFSYWHWYREACQLVQCRYGHLTGRNDWFQSLRVLSGPVLGLSMYSGFLPKSKDMHIRLISDSELAVCANFGINDCLC